MSTIFINTTDFRTRNKTSDSPYQPTWVPYSVYYAILQYIHDSIMYVLHFGHFRSWDLWEPCQKLRVECGKYNSVFAYVRPACHCTFCSRPLLWSWLNCVDLSNFSWSRLVSPFMRSWRWWRNRRHGTDWERHMTAQKQSISASGWPTGPSEKPSCCLSSALVKLCCSGVSSLRRKALWLPPLRTHSLDAPSEKLGRTSSHRRIFSKPFVEG